MKLLQKSALVSLLFSFTLAYAQDVYVPQELSPWKEWVLHGHEHVACPLSGNDHRCVWPGRLTLDANAEGGQFRQVVHVFDEQYFRLPGGAGFWPLDVTVNDKAVPVVKRDRRPVISLSPGEHTVSGTFAWPKMPDTLLLDNGTAMLDLSIGGEAIARPRWTAREVWISQGQPAQSEQTQNQISVSAYRLVRDGAPVVMEVTLQIDIAGESREETIGQLVPPGFKPALLDAPLPARLDDDGNLKIQARPGNWTFRFQSLMAAPLENLIFTPRGEHWPTEEIWSYASAPDLRATEIRADNAVDPAQSGVPDSWQTYPAFQMTADSAFEVIERQRGRAVGESNRLQLNRELWLDFDREGYTARDRVAGTMVRDWRLDMLAPFELASVRLQSPNEGEVNLLVTKKPGESEARGVEIRTPRVNLTALARLETKVNHIPVGGWDARFDAVTTQLYLPAGHRLLGVSNVDRARGSWVDRWDLLDFFVVLIVTIAVWRLVAPWAGVVALCALGLSFHETGAPQLAWLNLVAAFALAKYLPEGKIRSVLRGYSLLSLITLTLLLLPFAANALRTAVYPQLEVQAPSLFEPRKDITSNAPAVVQDSSSIEITNTVNSRSRPQLEEVRVTGSKSNALTRYAASARVQTGPGVPAWRWVGNELTWNGPVSADQTSRLWIAPPFMMRVWRVAMVGFLAALLAGFAGYALSLRTKLTNAGRSVPALLAGALLTTFALAPGQTAEAETPSEQVLQELRGRLLEAPKCAPNCVDVSRANVVLSNDGLVIQLIAHAQTNAVLPLPGRTGSWMPERVVLNGKEADRVSLGVNGSAGIAEVHLPEGVHRITLSGTLPNANSVGVAFPVLPHHVQVSGTGWEVTGIANAKLTGSALTLIRQQTGRERTALDALDVEQFPAFVVVRRQLQFDLDWSVRTTVERVTPPNAAINLDIPLLAGESITQDDIEVTEGLAQISIPAGEQNVSWTSSLVRESSMELVAARNVPWQEQWVLSAGDSWRLQFSGVPEVNDSRLHESLWRARFTPWPGEKLALNLTRPVAIEGATTAIDKVVLRETIGARSRTVQLDFSYRATRGSQHTISLPVDSELTAVNVDGQVLNLALEEGQLRLPIVPGSHQVEVHWRGPQGAAFHTTSAAIDLNMPASNVTTVISGNSNRWTLWTYGPLQGPAVLYWSELLALLLVAFGLAKFGGTPLRLHHWILLGLGFSTFFWPAFAIVAVALLALAWRRKQTITSRWKFNGLQLVLSGLVVAAAFALVGAIPYGLLGEANMHIAGNSSSAAYLRWFTDQTISALPQSGVLSAPMWVYKALILLWALWLAFALLRWLPWMWQSYSRDGFWRERDLESAEQASAP